MTRYRCIVFQNTGNFIPYSGFDFMAASDAMATYQHMGSVVVEKRGNDESEWVNVMGVWR